MSRSTAQRCIGQRHLQTVEAELLVIALSIQLMVAPHGQHQMSPLLLGAQRHSRILLAVYCTSSVCMQSMQSAPAKHQPLLKERLSQQPCHLNRASSAGFIWHYCLLVVDTSRNYRWFSHHVVQHMDVN
jgi:hypothetical protein